MKKLTLLVVALFLPALSVQAGEKEKLFTQLDIDTDGFISQSEAKALYRLSDVFAQLDSNGDRKLDAPEFSAFKPQVR